MNPADEKYMICEKIIRILDGAVSEEEFRAFEKILIENPQVRHIYMSVLKAHAYMQKPGHSAKINRVNEQRESEFDGLLWQLLAKAEMESPSVELPKTKSLPQIADSQKAQYAHDAPKRNKTAILSLILSVAAILLLMVFVHFAPVRGGSYGQITDHYQAVFQDSKSGVSRGQNLDSEPLKLDKGMIEIQMNSGSIVRVEAPAEIRLENSNQVFLIQGKLTANVPHQAIGFIVRTPSASIVDYGTEFGILVDQYANTEAHVLKGQVEMRLGSNIRVFDKTIRLLACQAGRASGQKLTTIPAVPSQFAYEMPSAFEANAMKLDPLFYFRFKENNIHTFCEITGKPGLTIAMDQELPLISGPLLDSGRSGYSLKMEGTAGFAVSNVFPVCRFETGDFTVAGWVRFDKIQKQVIWSNLVVGNTSTSGVKDKDSYYRVLWINDQGRLEHTAYYSERDVPSRKVNTIVSSATLEPNKWYFITVTHAAKKLKLMYINGELTAQSSTEQNGLLEKYTELTFGRPFEGLAGGLGGAISEILFYNRELTDKEIQKLYQSAMNK
jgi:hypothetical protein